MKPELCVESVVVPTASEVQVDPTESVFDHLESDSSALPMESKLWEEPAAVQKA